MLNDSLSTHPASHSMPRITYPSHYNISHYTLEPCHHVTNSSSLIAPDPSVSSSINALSSSFTERLVPRLNGVDISGVG